MIRRSSARLRAALPAQHEQVLIGVLRPPGGGPNVRAHGEPRNSRSSAARRSGSSARLPRIAIRGPNVSSNKAQYASGSELRSTYRSTLSSSGSRLPPNSSRTCFLLPHSSGGRRSEGGGRVGVPGARKTQPPRPPGVKLIIPIVPPGRQTRTSSSATACWSGRKDRAERGRDDVELAVSERERLGVRLDPVEIDAGGLGPRVRPASRLSGVRSDATTSAPVSAARIATVPVPAATSSTRWPAADPARLDEEAGRGPHRLLREAVVVAERPHGAGLGLGAVVRGHGLDPRQRCRLHHQRIGCGSAFHVATVRAVPAGRFATTGHLPDGWHSQQWLWVSACHGLRSPGGPMAKAGTRSRRSIVIAWRARPVPRSRSTPPCGPRPPAADGSGRSRSSRRTCAARCASTAPRWRRCSWSTTATRSPPSRCSSASRGWRSSCSRTGRTAAIGSRSWPSAAACRRRRWRCR